MTSQPTGVGHDVEYLDRYASVMGTRGVLGMLTDRENLDESTEEIAAILRANLDDAYEIIGRAIDRIESLIEEGDWTKGEEV